MHDVIVLLGINFLFYFFLHTISINCNKVLINHNAKFLIYWWQIFGVISHELGHYFFCKLFKHKVLKVVLYSPQANGTLGYVEHSYNRRSLFERVGNVFIGIAPVISGIFFSTLLTLLMWPDDGFVRLVSVTHTLIVGNGFSGYFELQPLLLRHYWQVFSEQPFKLAIWLYLLGSIVNHLTPSKADLEGARQGVVPFMFLLSVIVYLFGPEIIQFATWVLTLLISMFLSVVFVILFVQLVSLIIVKLLYTKGQGK